MVTNITKQSLLIANDSTLPQCNSHGIKCFTIVYIHFNRIKLTSCLSDHFRLLCRVSIIGWLTLQIVSPGNMEVISCLAGNLHSLSTLVLVMLSYFSGRVLLLQTCYILSTDLIILSLFYKYSCLYIFVLMCYYLKSRKFLH